MKTLAFVIAVVLFLPGYGGAQLVRHNGYSSLTASNSLPGNDLAIQPEWKRAADQQQFGVMLSLVKQLSSNSSLEVAANWTQVWPKRGHVRSGLTSVTLAPMYRFFKAPAHRFSLAVALDANIAAGGPGGAGSRDWTGIGPVLLGVKSFGNLPDEGWRRYFQPLLIQGDAEYTFGVSHVSRQRPAVNLAVSYSLRYLRRYTNSFDAAPQLLNLIPFLELNYKQEVGETQSRIPPDFRILPGVAYLAKTYQAPIGGQLPLNHRANRQDRIAILMLVAIFYDRLIPKLSNNLF